MQERELSLKIEKTKRKLWQKAMETNGGGTYHGVCNQQ